MKNRGTAYLNIVLLQLLLCGCGTRKVQESQPPNQTGVKAVAKELSVEPKKSSSKNIEPRLYDGLESVLGISMAVPEEWKRLNSPIGLKYVIPSVDGDVVVVIMPVGGGAELNTKRWIKEMGQGANAEEVVMSRVVAGVDSQWVDCTGEYSGHFAKTMANARMIGVLVPSEGKHVAFRFAGPVPSVNATEPQIIRFIEQLSGTRDETS